MEPPAPWPPGQPSYHVWESLAHNIEAIKTDILNLLKDTTWPRVSTSVVGQLTRTVAGFSAITENAPQDETGPRAHVGYALQNFIATMETVRTKIIKAAKTYGEMERGFGSAVKFAFKSVDKNQCTKLLQECDSEVKVSLSLLQNGWAHQLTSDVLGSSIGLVAQTNAPAAESQIQTSSTPPGNTRSATSHNGKPKHPADRGKWLGAMKVAFDAAEGVSGALPIVGSYVGAAAKVGNIIVQTVQNMDSNDSVCVELEGRTSRLAETLNAFRTQSAEARKDAVAASLDEVQRAIKETQKTAETVSSAATFKKALFADEHAGTLKDQSEKLRTALEVMQLLVHLDTAKLVTELYDAEGLKERRRLLDRLGDADYGFRGTSIDDVICLPGTRVATLERIGSWVRSRELDERVLWIRGMAGRGKSTIASTVANQWKTHAACAIFHFRRGQKTRDSRLVCGLARQLGSGHLVPEVKDAILEGIRKNEDIGQGRLHEQFQTLLAASFSKLQDSSPPVLLIVDALDECEDGKYSLEFVKLIDKYAASLPTNVKFLLTTRPEAPLLRELEPRQWNVEDLDSIGQVNDDVETFLRHGLSKIEKEHRLRDNWLPSGTIQSLVRMSEGLFQWANTVIEYINQGSPRRRLQELLKSPSIYTGLDSLYLQILDEAFSMAKTSQDRKDIFLRVLGTLVVAPYPVSLDSLAYLFADHPIFTDSSFDDSLELLWSEALSDLQSLIHVPDSSAAPIHLMHTSIRDLLVDSERCKGEPYHVDPASYHQCLASKSVGLMRRDLAINICHLTDLSKPNSDPDVQKLVQLQIHPGLQYCCRSWSLHLTGASIIAVGKDRELIANVVKLSEENLLSWLEVMSVIGRTREAMAAAKRMHSLAQEWPHDLLNGSFEALWSDADRFINSFFDPIDFGALHIYASALPVCPTSTTLWHLYKDLATTKVVIGPLRMVWSSTLWSRFIGERVLGLAFSPDGTMLASGTDKGNIQLRDVQTGAPVGEALRGHDKQIDAVAFSPDGKILVSGSQDSTIRLWDPQTGASAGEPLNGHDGSVYAVAFSPDGKLLVSASYDGTILRWNPQTRTRVGEPLNDHLGSVHALAFAPDGTAFVSASYDETIRIWDTQTGAPVKMPLLGHTSVVNGVAYSSDGKIIASGSRDATVRTWNAQTGAMIGKLEGDQGGVFAVSFAPNRNAFASGSGDKTIRIWDAKTVAAIGEPLRGHDSWVRALAFSPDGKVLASGSDDKTVRTWRIQTSVPSRASQSSDDFSLHALAFSPDLTILTSGSVDCTIRMLDVGSGFPFSETLEGHDESIHVAAFSPDGNLIASGSRDGTVRLWDSQTRAAVVGPLKGHYGPVYALAFAPCGKIIASGSDDQSIGLWDAQTGAPISEPLTGHAGPVYAVTFSPDGDVLLSGSADCTVRMWDVQTKTLIEDPLKGHESSVYAVKSSPDGKFIASGSRDGTIRIWDAHTGSPIQILLMKDHRLPVYALAFSPDGRILVSGSEDKTIRKWDFHNGDSAGKLMSGFSKPVRAVAFSPDGKLIAGSDGSTIRTWDAQTQNNRHYQIIASICAVHAVAFSPDGRIFASASSDTTIRLWDAQTGASIGEPLRSHDWPVYALTFSQNGAFLASGSWGNHPICVWDIETRLRISEPLKGHDSAVYALVFSPNGNLLASGSGDKTIRLWNVQTGVAVGEVLRGHDDYVIQISFSPDGKALASASHDTTVRIWDTQTGTLIGEPLRGHNGWVRRVAFTPDGKVLVSGGRDMTVRLWDARTRAPLKVIRNEHWDSVYAFAFSLNTEALLQDSREHFVVPVSLAESKSLWARSNQLLVHQSVPLTSEGQWITYLGRRILWLPPSYWTDADRIIIFSHGTLVLTCQKGIYISDLSGITNILP